MKGIISLCSVNTGGEKLKEDVSKIKPLHDPQVRNGEQSVQLSSWCSFCSVFTPSLQLSSAQHGVVDKTKVQSDNRMQKIFTAANLSPKLLLALYLVLK
ncbi:MAG: hypothetical protein IPJ20_04145 [Flammeovirgaceae bacterium]|nr:hypothetical protein [Flammeovirgaceae bacterium]